MFAAAWILVVMLRVRYGSFVVAAAFAVASATACGATSTAGGSHGEGSPISYPLYSEPGPASMHALTGPNGSVTYRPALPTTYETQPTPTCQRTTVQDGSGSAHTVVIPPTPGLRAEALTDHLTRVTWRFRDMPAECRPSLILISVSANDDPRATPLTLRLSPTGRSGSKVVEYPSFLDPPDVALASAELANGLRSGVASVLIRQP
jgi:hypothetical protein